MTEQKILDELRKLTNKDERKQRLAKAANMLLADYTSDDELTAFRSLDSEDFHV